MRFLKISGALAITRGYEFQREALNLIRLCWPNAIGVPAMSTFDQKGADHLVWSEAGSLPLVVQCKGFHEPNLGARQIAQVTASIEAFRQSGLIADRYMIVHNQDSRSQSFREAVSAQLHQLQSSGQARLAELHDRRSLVNLAYGGVYERALQSIDRLGLDYVDRQSTLESSLGEDVEQVPLRQSELLADSYSISASHSARELIANPAELLTVADADLSLLLGGFGAGKTTAALRAVAKRERRILYIPAAGISANSSGRKQFLMQCIEIDRILEGLPDDLVPLATDILGDVIVHITRDPEARLALLLDGLDESVFFSRPGGIAWLFSLLMEVRIPVILTARSEFWHARRADLDTLSDAFARRENPPKRRAKMLELLPWKAPQILECIDRRIQAQVDPDKRAHLNELRRAVEEDQIGTFYHDVPTRPLFLRYIIETVESDGLRTMGRAELFWRWLALKIQRDYMRPLQRGGRGRVLPSRTAASVSQIAELSVLAMQEAAKLMTVRPAHAGKGEGVELRSQCSFHDLQQSSPSLAALDDPAGLALFSLLRPCPPTSVLASPLLEFAHRSYQEYFTALNILARDEDSPPIEAYPPEVVAWWDAMKREGFAPPLPGSPTHKRL